MNNPSKKVCKLAILSISSFFGWIISFVFLICFASPNIISDYCYLFFFCVTPITSIVFGHLARHKVKKTPQLLSGKGVATIGLVFGYITLVLFLTSIFLISPINSHGNHRIMRTRSIINGLELALKTYKIDFGQFPKGTSKDISNELTGFRDNPSKPDDIYLNSSKWRGPYFGEGYRFKDSQRNQAILDPWGKPYNFDFKNDEIIIWSCGPNRINENGKGDDISNKPK